MGYNDYDDFWKTVKDGFNVVFFLLFIITILVTSLVLWPPAFLILVLLGVGIWILYKIGEAIK
jgi:hypothetical protein